MATTMEQGTKVTPSRDAILDEKELASVLGISVAKVLDADLPIIWFGRDKRFIYGQVLDVLAQRALRSL